MLFVDLLTRPGDQGEALREPRLRHHLRVSIILLLRQHVFHSQYLRWLGGGIHTIRYPSADQLVLRALLKMFHIFINNLPAYGTYQQRTPKLFVQGTANFPFRGR